MSALLNLTAAETKLFFREPVGVIFAVALPPVLLVVLGSISSFRVPDPETGLRVIDLYAPIVVGIGITALATSTLPPQLATYREKGILRRMRLTPARPGLVLGAQLLMSTALAVATTAAVLAIARLAFDVSLPAAVLAYGAAFALTALAMFALGLLVAAVAPSGASASAIGLVLFFPLLFFAGLWVPRDAMSDTLRRLRAEVGQAERREVAVITALPYLLLVICTAITVVRPAPVHLPAALGLTLLATAWLAWPVLVPSLRHLALSSAPSVPEPGRRTGRVLPALYYAGLVLLCAALVALAPWYGLFAFIGYVHAYVFLRGIWRYAGAAATSMIMAVTYLGGLGRISADEWWLWGAITVVSTALASIFFALTDRTDRHGHRQEQALAEVHEANVRLENALEKNAELQAQLLARARDAGVLDERQRVARELHDTLAQSLAGILTQLQAAEDTTDDPVLLGRHLTTATDLARESLAEARRTVHAVAPQVLVEARLPDAIGDVARRWSQAHEVDVAVSTTGDPRPLHTDVEVTLLRTAQEALANVAKHAGATRVGLTLSYMADRVTLDVRDDGFGFDPSARPACGAAYTDGGGFGLAGMRQRVRRLTGRLEIESEPGGDTALSASIPAIPAAAVGGTAPAPQTGGMP